MKKERQCDYIESLRLALEIVHEMCERDYDCKLDCLNGCDRYLAIGGIMRAICHEINRKNDSVKHAADTEGGDDNAIHETVCAEH